MLGANSAANASVKPSTAPFAEDTIAWLGKPCLTATVENNTIEPLFCFKLSAKALIIYAADTKFKLKDSMKSLFLINLIGFKSIEPTQ